MMIKVMALKRTRLRADRSRVGKIKGGPCVQSVYLLIAYLLFTCCSLTDAVSGRSGDRFGGVLANYSGDIVLGGLFPVHRFDHDHNTCGAIQEQDGVQMLEAMMFSLDEINQSGFLPGFTLGALIADTCDSATVGLERSVEFVRDLTESLYLSTQLQCPDGSSPRRAGTGNLERVVGVVGASASSVSTQIASFLRLFKVPQVSYLSTTPVLSNTERYGYFLRTVPSDRFQALAIIQILSRFDWTYVSVVYDDSPYGSELFGALDTLAIQYGICFAVTKKIRRYPAFRGDDLDLEMRLVVEDLTMKRNARVVVVLSNYNQARKLFEAASQNRDAVGLIWVGSDGWSGREVVVQGLGSVVHKAITVQPLGKSLRGFDEYFKNRKPTLNTRNPWFHEFWASHFSCHWQNSSPEWIRKHPKICNEDDAPNAKNGYRQFLALTYVRDAVQVYAHALRDMHADRCGNRSGLCPAMDLSTITGEDLLAYMKNVTFSENGQEFSFVDGVDGPPRYSILSYRLQKGAYSWVEIGNYTHEKNQEKIMPVDLFDHFRPDYPSSFCSRDCRENQARKMSERDHCCWICVNCTYYQYLPTESECVDCPAGQLPNPLYNACVPIPEVFMAHGQGLSVGLSAFSLSGIILCFLIGAIFLRFRKTPVIKASGVELSFALLAGVALSYGATFSFVTEPRPVACGFTRFLFGLSYTISYAAILIKTNRIARIFHGGENGAVKTKYTTPKSQMIFLFGLTSVELVILMAWTVLNVPDVDHLYPTRADNIRICAQSDDASYLIGLIYPFLLVVLCTVYAVKTRKTPDGFNEARFIAFCAYSTCILWLSFVPIYFTNSDHALRVVTMSVSLSVNGTVILVCLFFPKVYIVILRPSKNTREAVMARSATFKSSDEHPVPSAVHNENQENMPDRSAGRPEEIDISVISGPRMGSSSKSSEKDPATDAQNLSTDSGCYVNAGFRDSRVYLDDYVSSDNTETGAGAGVTNIYVEIVDGSSRTEREESAKSDVKEDVSTSKKTS